MFTKKTRVSSALLTVCMLISLLACFVVPASAEPVNYTLFGADEKATETGLKDVTALPDIKNGLVSGKNEYKITDRAGFEKMDALVRAGSPMNGKTIYQANDIDMKWDNFYGIGTGVEYGTSAGKAQFSGTFDGNGFVIENLLIYRGGLNNVGLFGNTYWAGTILRNVGIASGLVIGQQHVGALVGQAYNTKVENCWSAATVVGKDRVGGLIGYARWESANVVNSYVLGMVFEGSFSAGGLAGYLEAGNGGTQPPKFRNSYAYGSVGTSYTNNNVVKVGETVYSAQGITNAFVRIADRTSYGKFGTNNYYRKQESLYSAKEALAAATDANNGVAPFTTDDDATGVTAEGFKTLAASLNDKDSDNTLSTGAVNGYIVRYDDTSAGYPVIAYYKKADDTTPVVRRMAHTTDFVGDVSSFREKSALFDAVWGALETSRKNKTTPSFNLKATNISNADDLLALTLLLMHAQKNAITYYGITSFELKNDIDMKNISVFADAKDGIKLDNFMPMMGPVGHALTVPFNGNKHTVKNWKTVHYIGASSYYGFFGYQDSEIKDFGLVDASVVVRPHIASSNTTYPSILASVNRTGAKMTNVFVTGNMIFEGGAVGSANNYGALSSRTMKTGVTFTNSWADVTLTLNGNEYALPVLGGNGEEITYSNVHHFSEVGLAEYGNVILGYGNSAYELNKTAHIKPSEYPTNAAKAWALNDSEKGYYWKATANGITWATATDAARRYTVEKYDVNGALATSEYGYANAGATVTLEDIGNYDFDAEASVVTGYSNGAFTVPANDTVKIVYTAKGFDFNLAKDLYDTYKNLNTDYFSADFKAGMADLAGILAQESNPTDNAATLIGKFDAAKAKIKSRAFLANTTAVTKETLKVVPDFSEYATYKDYNTANVWGVSDKEDWIALVNAGTAVATYKIYLKGNIDMDNVQTAPLCFGGYFKGSLNGMGYYFEKLNVFATSNAATKGAALIAATTDTVYISNLGIKSGKVTQDWISNDNAGLALFVAYSPDGSAKFDRCWAGPKTKVISVNKVGASVGLFAGRHSCEIKNCYAYTTFEASMATVGGGYAYSPSRATNTFVQLNYNGPRQHGAHFIRTGGTSSNPPLGWAKNVYVQNANSVVGNATRDDDASATARYLGEKLPADAPLAEAAWLMNQGRKQFSADATDAKFQADTSDWEYWTLDKDGYPVFGTEENQTRKLSIVATQANGKELVVYGKEGDTVDLLELLNVAELPANALVAAAGNVGTVSGSTFTFGKGDAFYTTDIKLLNTADYNTLAELYADHPEFYGDAVKSKLDAIKAKIDADGYEQEGFDTDIKAVVPLFEVTEESVVPVTMNREAVTLLCGESIAAVANPVGNETYLQVGIYNTDDLIYAAHGPAKELDYSKNFSTKQTLNLMADMDLTGKFGAAADGKFERFHDLSAAFNGNHHTISNWNPTSTAAFVAYPKKEIRNIRFYNCNPTVTGCGALVVSQYWGGSSAALIENIVVENCTVTGSNTYGAGVILGNTRAINQTIRNITVRNTVITHTSGVSRTENSGMITGRIREGGSLTIENVLIEGSENTNGNNDGVGLVFGSIDQNSSGSAGTAVTIDGLILRNNRGTDIQTVLGGAWQRPTTTKPNSITLKNALIFNNNTGSAPLIKNQHSSTTVVPAVGTNVYTDVANTVYGGVELATGKLTTADFANGKAVYEANKAAGEVLFKVDAAGNIYFADKAPAGAVAPVKVSFMKGEEEVLAYYTNGENHLVGADANAVLALAECKIVDAEGTNVKAILAGLLAGTFTADTVYTLSNHDLQAIHNEGAVSHNIVCENGCGYLAEDLPCVDGEGYPKPEPATEEAEGYTAHKCGACGYEWTDSFTHKLVVLKADDKNTVMKGEDFKIDVTIANADLLTELVVGLNFNPDSFEYVTINRTDLVVDESRLNEGVLLISNPDGAEVTSGNTGVWVTVTFIAKEDAVDDGDLEIMATVVNAKMGAEDVTVENNPVSNVVNVNKQVRGDLTGDGAVNTADATVMLRHFAGETLLSEDEKAMGDIDRDGTFSIVDVLYLLRTLA